MPKINSIGNQSGSLTIDPGASGDSWTQYNINTSAKFRIGVYDTDDSFRISTGNDLSTNNMFIVTTAGEITKPLQPAFLAVLDSTISDVTGDGTGYSIVWDTTVFDQNSDFDGTSTFTAPVTGRYRFDIGVTLGDLAAGHNNINPQLITSNRSYAYYQINPGAARDVNNNLAYCFTCIVDMDAADTAYVRIAVYGSTKVVDIVSNGSADPYNWFSGNLEC